MIKLSGHWSNPNLNGGLARLIISLAGAVLGLVMLLSYATAAQMPTGASSTGSAFLPRLQAAKQAEALTRPSDLPSQGHASVVFDHPGVSVAPASPLAMTLCTSPTLVSAGGVNGQPAIADMADGSRRIAFWSTGSMADDVQNRDGNIEIFVADIPSSGALAKFTQVTSSTGSVLGGFNLAPSISADGARIAFFSDRDLTPPGNRERNFEVFIADVSITGDSIKITQVTSTTKGVSILPSLSADGSHIAYISDSDGNMEVFLAEIGTHYKITRTQVTSTSVGAHDQPSISADGKQIAFVYDDGWDRGIRLARWISGTFADDPVTPISGTVSDQPSISADGRYIAFVSNLDLTGENLDGNQEVFLAQVNAAPIVTFTQLSFTTAGYNDRPSLNTDGTRFAYVPTDNNGIIFYDRIYSDVSPLRPAGSQPAISSGGGSLAFISSDENSLHGLFVAKCDLAGLAVTKFVEPAEPVAGDYMTYTLVVSNAGPSPSTGVIVTDRLPPSVTLQSVVPAANGWDCGITTTIAFTCAKGQLNARTAEMLRVVGQTASGRRGALWNVAGVKGDVLEHNLVDNSYGHLAHIYLRTDLSVTLKSITPNPAVAGRNLTYTLVITNYGPSDSTGLTLTSKLPSSALFSGTLPYGCGPGGATVITCTWSNLAKEVGKWVALPVHVDQYASLSLSYTAAVTTNLPLSEIDPDVSNNETGVTVMVIAEADLGVSKVSLPPAGVIAGEFLTYTLVVSNAGPSAVGNVRLTDTLPAGVVFSSVVPITSCALAPSNVVTCAWNSLALKERVPVTIGVWVKPDTRYWVSNTAIVTSSAAADLGPQPNTSTFATSVNTRADLWVSKSGQPATVVAGRDLTYTLFITNVGPSDATSVRLTDTLPLSVTFVSASNANCHSTTALVICAWSRLTPGQSDSTTVRVRVDPRARTQLQNSVVAQAVEPDPGGHPRTAQVTTNMITQVDLGLAKSGSADPVIAGEFLTYTLVVSNAGPSQATGIKLTDTLPSKVTYSSYTASQGSCTGGGTVNCTLGNLMPGANITVALRVRADPTNRDTFTNTAKVGSVEADTFLANNTAPVVATTVTTLVDVSIIKSAIPHPNVVAGERLTYTLVVHNAGPSQATGVRLTDTLPSKVTFSSYTASQGSCAGSSPVTCNLGSLMPAADATVTLVVTVKPAAQGLLFNTVTVGSIEADSFLGNNASSINNTITTQSDLAIAKWDRPDPVSPGEVLTYTVTYTNYGPSDAQQVYLTDTLPINVTFGGVVSQPPALSGPGVAGNTYSWYTPTLAASAVGAIVFTVTVDQPVISGTVLYNSVGIRSVTTDTNLLNNYPPAVETLVATKADLAVSKTAWPATVVAGRVLTYTLIVANAGPSPATNVLLTDTLPLSVTFGAPTVTAGGICTKTSAVLTCAWVTLPRYASASASITGAVDPAKRGALVNTARVSSQDIDLYPADNTQTVTTTVRPETDLQARKSADPTPTVTAGNPITYTIVVTNAGPSLATNVRLTDTLPPSLTSRWNGNVLLLHLDELSGATQFADSSGYGNNASCSGTCPIAEVAGKYGTAIEFDDTMYEYITVADASTLDMTRFSIGAWIFIPSGGLSNVVYMIRKGPVGNPGANHNYWLYLDSSEKVNAGYGDGNGHTCSKKTSSGLSANAWHHVMATYDGTNIKIYVDGGAPSNWACDRTPYSNTDSMRIGGVVDWGGDDGTKFDEVVIFNRALSIDEIIAVKNNTGIKSSRGTCSSVNNQTVTCTLGIMQPGATAMVTIPLRVASAHPGGWITNTVVVTSTEPDPYVDNNTSNAKSYIGPAPDLALNKWASVDPVAAGTSFVYTLTVSNNGSVSATAVILTDTLPVVSGVTYGAPQASGTGSCSFTILQQKFKCNWASVLAGQQVTATIPVTVGAAVTGILYNNAEVSCAQPENRTDNIVQNMPTEVTAEANLSIGKSDAPDPVWARAPLTYTLQVNNTGPSVARNITVTDNLPVGVGFKNWAGNGWTCSYSLVSNRVTCTWPGPLTGPAPSITLVITSPDAGGSILNSATVTSTAYDPQLVNNIATASTQVKPHADLSITKSDNPDPVVAGGRLTYTLQVNNAGPSTAYSIRVTDTLPFGMTHIGTYPDGDWACYLPVGRVVTCTLGSLSVGPAHDIAIVITAPSSGGSIANEARIDSATPDLFSSNNISTTNTLVDRRPEVDLDGSGGDIHYETSFTENGGAVNIEDSDMTVSDLDGDPLDLATVTITNLQDGAAEALTATAFGGIGAGDITYNSATGVLTIDPVGTASLADFQAVLCTVRYNNTSENPNTAQRLIDFMVHDGVASNSPLARTTLTVIAVNDRPVVDLDSSAAGIDYATSFTENGGPVYIENNSGLTVSDLDDTTLDRAVVTITNLQDGAAEVLMATASGGIVAGDITYAVGVLTINPAGAVSLTDFRNVLRTVRYNNTSENPNTAQRLIDFMVHDGVASNSPLARTTLTVIAINDAPVNTVPGAQTTPKNTKLYFSTASGNPISTSDVDAGANPVSVTLTAINGTLTLSVTTGLTFSQGDGANDVWMAFRGTIANANTAMNGMYFDPTPSYTGSASVQIMTNDRGYTGSGGAKSDTDTVSINVTSALVSQPAGRLPVAEGGVGGTRGLTGSIWTMANKMTLAANALLRAIPNKFITIWEGQLPIGAAGENPRAVRLYPSIHRKD